MRCDEVSQDYDGEIVYLRRKHARTTALETLVMIEDEYRVQMKSR